jgi:hypothetical protein
MQFPKIAQDQPEVLLCRLSISLKGEASEQPLLDMCKVFQSSYATRPDLIPSGKSTPLGEIVVEMERWSHRPADFPQAFLVALWDEGHYDPIGLRIEVGTGDHHIQAGVSRWQALHSHTLDLPRSPVSPSDYSV